MTEPKHAPLPWPAGRLALLRKWSSDEWNNPVTDAPKIVGELLDLVEPLLAACKAAMEYAPNEVEANRLRAAIQKAEAVK